MTIRVKRGPSSSIPSLQEGELGYTIDTNDLYIGTNSGNKKYAKQTDLDATNSQLVDIATFNDYSSIVTRDSTGNILQIDLKDGDNVVQTTTINRDINGDIISVIDVANGKTVTTTVDRASDGTVFSISKAVV